MGKVRCLPNPKYAALFFMMGAVILFLAVQTMAETWNIVAMASLLWLAVSFSLVGAAYAGGGAAFLGKRADGSRPLLQTLAFAPYLLLTEGIWYARTAFHRTRSHEVLPHLFLGVRPRTARDLPLGITDVVDVTCELAPARSVRSVASYQCFPILDVHIPDDETVLQKTISYVEHALQQGGTVYLHCAVGRGRSAMIAAGVLLSQGRAATAEEAEAIVRAIRPGVRLSLIQREALVRFADWHRGGNVKCVIKCVENHVGFSKSIEIDE